MRTVNIDVEFVFATPEDQFLVEVRLPEGASIADVIEASGVRERFPDIKVDTLDAGVWGKFRERDTLVQSGDRVELYRELLIDPRDARRARAGSG